MRECRGLWSSVCWWTVNDTRSISPGAGRATEDVLGRNYVGLNVADFTRLMLGQLDWDRAMVEGRVEPSTALAEEAAASSFPRCPTGARCWMICWRSNRSWKGHAAPADRSFNVASTSSVFATSPAARYNILEAT